MTGRSQKVLWNDKTNKLRPLTHGVPQGSILGPTLFLVMVADMPKYVIGDTPNAKTIGYANDSIVYIHSKCIDSLKHGLESVSNRMISYCYSAGLILNNDKTQLLITKTSVPYQNVL